MRENENGAERSGTRSARRGIDFRPSAEVRERGKMLAVLEAVERSELSSELRSRRSRIAECLRVSAGMRNEESITRVALVNNALYYLTQSTQVRRRASGTCTCLVVGLRADYESKTRAIASDRSEEPTERSF